MNLLEDTPTYLIVLYLLLLAAAAIEDVVRMRISNLTSLAIAVLAVVAAIVAGFELDFWKNLVVVAGLLVAGTLLFATGKFGGGDVKLFAATGLWFDFGGALKFLPAVLISGGVLALVLIAARSFAPAGARSRIRLLRPGSGIPYGVAIVIGAVVALLLIRT